MCACVLPPLALFPLIWSFIAYFCGQQEVQGGSSNSLPTFERTPSKFLFLAAPICRCILSRAIGKLIEIGNLIIN